jgi:hypothetical protein
MTLNPETLAQEYPRLYHMAEPGAWPSIRKYGLLSTTSLLDLFEINGVRRRAIEAQHRPESITLSHPQLGTAVVRDQKPMSDAALEKCLTDGLTPEAWYRLLNRHVFFWLSRQRLDRLLDARAYRHQRHTILEVNTSSLLDAYAKRVVLAPINSGSTIMKPQPRGAATFQTISSYPYAAWRAKRGRRDAVVELAVRGGVQDVERFVLRVTEEGAGGGVKVLYEASYLPPASAR